MAPTYSVKNLAYVLQPQIYYFICLFCVNICKLKLKKYGKYNSRIILVKYRCSRFRNNRQVFHSGHTGFLAHFADSTHALSVRYKVGLIRMSAVRIMQMLLISVANVVRE